MSATFALITLLPLMLLPHCRARSFIHRMARSRITCIALFYPNVGLTDDAVIVRYPKCEVHAKHVAHSHASTTTDVP